MYTIEAGFFSNCLDQAMAGPAEPFILNQSELSNGADIAIAQHRAYWVAFGLNLFNRQSNIASTFLRFQAQAERLHRRAVEDFHRLMQLRDLLPPENYQEPIEPTNEPISPPQAVENTAPPAAEQTNKTANEPNLVPKSRASP